ncbi:DUF6526 family protein [Flavobacterium agrisoli]|uniref:Uncharacterized protein n=1 Tax=Flavobacterium agrisoli TaxID=2793066 RepID=A0A934UIK0_9FLAO|nr:DUF6526 family protein [Flavobacterium agrisoli]MBK0368912.1 hypothetical protein [Flavobacterium agrisoli]
MQTQSYSNHIRFYTPHHFVFYPILMIIIGLACYYGYNSSEPLIWTFIVILLVFVFILSFMLRQHYALTLQNRIVKLEMRYRYFALTGKRFEILETQLNDGQIFALRFAPDEELILLIQKTISEKWSAKTIKKNIVNWKPDYERV